MPRYTADTEQILALVERARAIGNQIDERVSPVEREVDALHVHWDGDAAGAHRDNHDKWQREMREMRSVLTGLERSVRDARERHITTVEHNSRMWP